MYLYVKTHNKTGLKYLGKTNSKDPHAYTGSGKYWKKHLKKHGLDYITEIILETDNEQELINKGIEYSVEHDIVESNDWANIKIEKGDGGWEFVNTDPILRQKRKERTLGNGNSFYGKKHTDETKKLISKRTREAMLFLPPRTKEHNERISKGLMGHIVSDKSRKKQSESMKGCAPWNKGLKRK